MTVDESFKKPGAIPFKWEIRPGVPRVQQPHPDRKQPAAAPPLPPREDSLKLQPPPVSSRFHPPEELPIRTHSFRSAPRSRSERFRLDKPMLARPECVSPGLGCFPAAPLTKRRESKLRIIPRAAADLEPDYSSDLGTPSRFSVSSRRLLSPFRGTPCSTPYRSAQSSPRFSFSSYLSSRSSPQSIHDAEWAWFGLF